MRYDDLYKALADEHRREIVTALCEQPVVAGDLARRVGLAPNALSFHLKWLRSSGLIDMKRRGRHLWYHINGQTLDAWRDHVNGAFLTQGPQHALPPNRAQHPVEVDPLQIAPRLEPVAIVGDDTDLPSELL